MGSTDHRTVARPAEPPRGGWLPVGGGSDATKDMRVEAISIRMEGMSSGLSQGKAAGREESTQVRIRGNPHI